MAQLCHGGGVPDTLTPPSWDSEERLYNQKLRDLPQAASILIWMDSLSVLTFRGPDTESDELRITLTTLNQRNGKLVAAVPDVGLSPRLPVCT
jgi:hypothetical protein